MDFLKKLLAKATFKRIALAVFLVSGLAIGRVSCEDLQAELPGIIGSPAPAPAEPAK